MSPLRTADGRNLAALRQREWLLTDGRGGYALGTHALLNTRKYHGLLVVSRPAPAGRLMLFPRVEETLRFEDGTTEPLDVACYEPGILHPEGYRALAGFASEPVPTWSLRVRDVEIERSITMDKGRSGVTLRWRLISGPACRLEVRPMLTRRSHHAVARAADLQPVVECSPGTLRWSPRAGDPATVLSWNGEVVDSASHFYRDVLYEVEKERGYDAVEDLHAPAILGFSLTLGYVAELNARAEDDVPAEPIIAIAGESRVAPRTRHADARAALVRAADAFLIVGSGGDAGIVAGYPWFEEWGRDTMIALPGLCLQTGRADMAFRMLTAWSGRLDRGLLPNRLGDRHAVETNTVDAPLLFVRAVQRLDVALRDRRRVARHFAPAVHHILDWYQRGTGHGIGVDADGLLRAGEPGLALTWMDAVVNGEPVTPRRGKPVEINALYGEALGYGAELADRLRQDVLAATLRGRRSKLLNTMREKFLDPSTGYLRDVVDPAGVGDPDGFRPNLLFALAVEDSALTRDEAERNLARVELDLVTPFGLRTLSPSHDLYVGRYAGVQAARDRAYHQGTAWPWLLGVYADALLAVRGDHARTRASITAALTPLLAWVVENGSIPEVFDGDAPHAAGGCPAQAWSVSEVLRVLDAIDAAPSRS